MRLDWLAWSNPLAIWWSFLILVSAGNLALLLNLHSQYSRTGSPRRAGARAVEPLLLLCAAYVIGCAFRSILPRADVQRICLFDTWLSSVFVGRSVATVAELCLSFNGQWSCAPDEENPVPIFRPRGPIAEIHVIGKPGRNRLPEAHFIPLVQGQVCARA